MGSLARNENLDRLRDGATWDVVVIGGGATGLGSAVDAASRGYRTLLLEARDFRQFQPGDLRDSVFILEPPVL